MNASSKNKRAEIVNSRSIFSNVENTKRPKPVTTGLRERSENDDSDRRIINFYDHDFLITKNVLIPRPETEMIIDAVLNLLGKPYLKGVKPNKPKLPENCKILDVGTGSGCIAITLKLKLPNAHITASDVSKKALTIAKKNANRLNVNINFIKSNLLKNLGQDFDIIVANLPYVDKNWPWLDKKSLKKEPKIALYAKDRGLKLIKKLIKQAANQKIKYLILESDPCQHKAIQSFAKKHHYTLLETRSFIQVFKY